MTIKQFVKELKHIFDKELEAGGHLELHDGKEYDLKEIEGDKNMVVVGKDHTETFILHIIKVNDK